LVRREDRKVSIFEVKRSGTDDAVESLAKTIEYAAALWHVTREPEARRALWSLVGSRQQTEQLRFEAVAVVEERLELERELQAAARKLGAFADISLRALLCSTAPNAMQLRWLDVL
jgi:hypothetical protein